MSAAYVTDTHPLVFHVAGGRKLGKKAARIFRDAEAQRAIVYVPVSVLWELSILIRIGRIDLGRTLDAFTQDLFSNTAYQCHDLALEQVILADSSRPNDDPFDGMICAAARSLGLPLISRDADIHAFAAVSCVW